VKEKAAPSWPIRALRIVASSWLVAGLAAAAIIWLNARETVTTTRTITAHASLTFQDIETHVSVFRVAMGFVAVLVGLTMWALLLVVASRAEPESSAGTGRDPSMPG
jgi:hypothetical protein